MGKEEIDSQIDDLESDVTADEEVSHENGTPNRLAALQAKQNEAALTQLLADKDIQAVIAARRAGKTVKISEEVAEKIEDAQDEVEDLTAGLDDKDPLKKTLGSIQKILTQGLKGLESRFDDRLKSVEHVSEEVKRRDVTDQIATVAKKYRDFKDFREPMVELSKQHPGLGVEDLYILSKNRAGKLRLAESATFSEKPSAFSLPGGPAKRAEVKKDRPNGRQGFTQILREGLSRLDVGGDKE